MRAAPDRLILGDNCAVMAEPAARPGRADQPDLRRSAVLHEPQATRHALAAGRTRASPEDWALAEGYADDWPDLDAYLEFLYQRLALMHRLLSPTRDPVPAPGLARQFLCAGAAG